MLAESSTFSLNPRAENRPRATSHDAMPHPQQVLGCDHSAAPWGHMDPCDHASMRACDAARVWAPSHVDAASLNVVRRATHWRLAFQTRDIAGRGVLVLIPAAYEYVVEDKMKSSGVSMLRMSLAGSHTVQVAIARRGAHVESTATCINIPDISLFTLRVP